MGDIIGGIIGGIGSIVGGNQAKTAGRDAATQALTGYNYLAANPLINSTQANASAAQSGLANTTGAINSLLTSNGTDSPAFKNYLNSTGYNFQLGQGQQAITGSNAAKGLLNSGATGKALTEFGQGLAGNYFNNYLGQLGSLAGIQNTQVNQGLRAAATTGQAATEGGITGANDLLQGGLGKANATTTAFGSFGNSASNALGMFGV